MKNRDRYILQRNEYDMLLALQTAISTGLCQCVIEALTGKEQMCDTGRVSLDTCEYCIRYWLNEDKDES